MVYKKNTDMDIKNFTMRISGFKGLGHSPEDEP